MVKEFNITLDIKKEPINNKITGLNLNDEATIKIKFVQNSLPYDINNKDIRIDYRLPNGVLLFQNENTGVTKIDGNTINIKVINQALQQVGEIVLDVSIFEKSTSKKITTSKLILKVDSIIYKEEQLSTDFDALQTALNDSKKLESRLGTAKDLDNKLQQDFKTGNALDNTLKEDIKNANTSRSNLEVSINKANTTRSNLENTINTGDKLKQELNINTYVTHAKYSEFEKKTNSQYEDLANNYKHLGINLLPDSAFETGLVKQNLKNLEGTGYTTLSIGKPVYGAALKNHDCLFIESNKNAKTNCFVYTGSKANVEEGKTYTISFYYMCRSDQGVVSSIYFQDNKGNNYKLLDGDIDTKSVWKKHITTWKCPEGVTTLAPRFGFTTVNNAWLQVCCVKIEEGTIATDWTPSLEDYNYLVDVQSKRLDSIEKILIEKGFMTAQQTLNK